MVARQQSFLVICLIMAIFLVGSVFAVTTFTAKETDLLTLSVDAIDLDGDNLVYNFSFPFDNEGKWLTDYDSAGEYLVNISATDGIETVTKYVRVIVEEKNREPYLSSNTLAFNEQDVIDLTEFLVDPDQDVLIYSFSEPFSKEGVWQPGFDDAGRYVVDVNISDSEFTISRNIEVIIEESNQPPTFVDSFSNDSNLFVAEGDSLDFWVIAQDGDGDQLNYTWDFTDLGKASGQNGTLTFDYFSEGEYLLSVVVSDGEFEIKKQWSLFVENTNRVPKLDFDSYDFTAAEGQRVKLTLPEFDQDGDKLFFKFEEPFNSEGEWLIDYDSVGDHTHQVILNDGEYSSVIEVNIAVKNTDRVPKFDYSLSRYYYAEGEFLSLDLSVYDLDGEVPTLEILNGPAGLILNKVSESRYNLEWDIPFDTIKRSPNFITNILNALRLEQSLLKKKSQEIDLLACSNGLCEQETIIIYVENTNLPPQVVEVYDQYVTELDTVEPYFLATDPDGDIVKYYFSEPLKKSGIWETTYDDQGEYQVIVTASDGYLTDSRTINVNVANLNRRPTIWSDKESYTVFEGEEIRFKVEASDEDDDDELIMVLTKGPIEANLIDQVFSWTPSYDVVSKGTSVESASVEKPSSSSKDADTQVIYLEFIVNDSKETAVLPVELIVKNTNRKPIMLSSNPAVFSDVVEAGVPIDFSVDVVDPDQDNLEYVWSFSGFDFEKVSGTDHISRTFTSAGEKFVTVKITDGVDSIEHTWSLEVKESRNPTNEVVNSNIKSVPTNKNNKQSDLQYKVYTVENWK